MIHLWAAVVFKIVVVASHPGMKPLLNSYLMEDSTSNSVGVFQPRRLELLLYYQYELSEFFLTPLHGKRLQKSAQNKVCKLGFGVDPHIFETSGPRCRLYGLQSFFSVSNLSTFRENLL